MMCAVHCEQPAISSSTAWTQEHKDARIGNEAVLQAIVAIQATIERVARVPPGTGTPVPLSGWREEDGRMREGLFPRLHVRDFSHSRAHGYRPTFFPDHHPLPVDKRRAAWARLHSTGDIMPDPIALLEFERRTGRGNVRLITGAHNLTHSSVARRQAAPPECAHVPRVEARCLLPPLPHPSTHPLFITVRPSANVPSALHHSCPACLCSLLPASLSLPLP